MSYVNPIELLEQEERALQEKIYGTPEGEATTEPEATAEDTVHTEAPVKPELVPQAQQPEEDWEKRYKNLRASRDENLWKTKTQLSAALETINTLQSEVRKLQKSQPTVDPLEGVFTDEDTETLGSATIEAMRRATKKATEAATKPLQEQLELERNAREKQAEELAKQSAQDAYGIFLKRVADAVPDWDAINFDPNFAKWMEDPDYDGTPRKNYFHQAEAQGNSALVIRYMKEYKEASKPKDKLASKVAPVGDRASVTAIDQKKPGGQTISKVYIDKFYDDLARGRYRGRTSEANAIEAAIDKAVMEGRVVA